MRTGEVQKSSHQMSYARIQPDGPVMGIYEMKPDADSEQKGSIRQSNYVS